MWNERTRKSLIKHLAEMSQRKAAQLAGVSPTLLQKWLEKGKIDAEAGEQSEYAHFYLEVEISRAKREQVLRAAHHKHTQDRIVTETRKTYRYDEDGNREAVLEIETRRMIPASERAILQELKWINPEDYQDASDAPPGDIQIKIGFDDDSDSDQPEDI
jgi:transposase